MYHAVVSTDATGPGLRVIRWSGAAYVVEDPQVTVGPLNDGLSSFRVAVSPEGNIHLLAQAWSGAAARATRAAAWSSESVPLLTADARPQRMVASTGNVLTVVSYDWTQSQLSVRSRDGGGWGSPVLLAGGGTLDPSGLRVGTSVSGGTPALAVSTPGGVQLARASDGWAEHLLTGAYGLLGIGYDGTGHLYVLVSGGFPFDGTSPVAIYRER